MDSFNVGWSSTLGRELRVVEDRAHFEERHS